MFIFTKNGKNVKIERTREKHLPKHQWTTFWMKTLNKSFIIDLNLTENTKKDRY